MNIQNYQKKSLRTFNETFISIFKTDENLMKEII